MFSKKKEQEDKIELLSQKIKEISMDLSLLRGELKSNHVIFGSAICWDPSRIDLVSLNEDIDLIKQYLNIEKQETKIEKKMVKIKKDKG